MFLSKFSPSGADLREFFSSEITALFGASEHVSSRGLQLPKQVVGT
jgi:hypothetical protein